MEKQKRKIVIVDDEQIVTKTLNMLVGLEFNEDVQCFNDPSEALSYIQHNGADLIISDFLMPKMNGIEFLRQAKEMTSNACLILLTGYADKENAIKAINEVGIYRYMEKPWNNDDLIMAIRNGLERTELINKLTLEQEMNKLRDDFIATLTHDLRTPLLAAIQTLRFFLDGTLGSLNEKQQQFLSTMLTSNKDMLGLVNALLEVYKYESGQLFLHKDRFMLDELVSHCIDELLPLAQKKNITLEYSEDKTQVFADKQELRRVVSNLLGNALNYTKDGGNIKVNLSKQSEYAVVSVEDNGVGIPSEDISNIFRRFSQGTKNKRSTGTGLGLYLSRQIVEAHDGKISLKSELGKGSTFVFEIPLITKEFESSDEVAESVNV